MRWFGKAYGCAYESDMPHAPTPVGESCAHCDEAISDGDTGLITAYLGTEGWTFKPLHYDCHMRGIVGGLNHQLGKCTCCGGTEPPDPPHMSKRAAAIAAVNCFYLKKAGS